MPDHSIPYLQLYLLGAGLVVVMTGLKLLLARLLRTLTGTGCYWANLEKIGLYPNGIDGGFSHWKNTYWEVAGAFALEVSLSWINVVFCGYQIGKQLLSLPTYFLAKLPENFLRLRLPLTCNPHLEPEVVWAHLCAMGIILSGTQPDYEKIMSDLVRYEDDLKGFDRFKAIQALEDLEVIKSKATLVQCREAR